MDNKERDPLRRLVQASMLAAMACVATLVIQIPSPMNGYVNLGDAVVLLSGWLLGPWYGFAAAGVGSMLADLFSGYAHYAAGTLLIKGAMAAVAGALCGAVCRMGGRPLPARLISAAAAETVMVLGYFAFAGLWLGNGLAAAASIPGNLVQAAFGLAAGILLAAALGRAGVGLAGGGTGRKI